MYIFFPLAEERVRERERETEREREGGGEREGGDRVNNVAHTPRCFSLVFCLSNKLL